MADNREAEARGIMFRWVTARLTLDTLEGGQDLWADYADLGQEDWEWVEEAMGAYARSVEPTVEEYEAAYEFLSKRAEQSW